LLRSIGELCFQLWKALGTGQRVVQIGAAGMRQLGDGLAGGRVPDLLFAAAIAAQELAIDVKGKGFVHASLLTM